ncbi:MAG: hypothetical protein HUJ56_06745 [Erysipelotrichaceae bacterium]|nr:hypothetical protein [Erysipelotrichaceae bacterium]
MTYRDSTFYNHVDESVSNRIKVIMDKVFEEYACKSSWSLSRLTHGEFAWKNSRIGIPEDANSDNPMSNDIMKDADRIRERRTSLTQLGLN